MLSGKFVFAHSQEVPQIWWVDFLVLGRDKQGGNTKEVEVALLRVLAAQELVNDMGCHVETLRSQSEFPVDIYNPLQEEGSGGVLDLCLHLAEVIGINHVLLFLLQVRQVDILRELCHGQGVVVVLLIALWDVLEVFLHLLLHSQLVHFLDPVGMEIKVALLRWLLVHGLFIGGSAYVILLVIDSVNLDWFGGLLLSLANATLRTNWQSIDRFFHVFWVQPTARIEMKKRNFCYLHSDIPW